MANKKINQLVSKTSILGTDLFPLGDGTTGQLFKKTVAELQAAIGGAVISVNGLVGTVVLDTDDIQELPSPTNRYFTDARARGAISLTVSGASGASTYNSSTGVLNVPTYTLAGLGGITASFLSGGTGITYNSGTGVIAYSGTVYTDSSIRGLFSGGTGITYNSSTGAISYSGTVYTDSSIRGLFSGSTGISYNSSTGAISSTITQYTDALARASISLTTTGTSGASTYNSTTGVLNIPQYQAVLTNPITGTGTTNYVTKWTSSSAVGNSQIFDNGTNVGINTASPTQRLDVNGAIRTSGNFYAVNNTPFSTNGTITYHDTVGLVLRGVAGFAFDFSVYNPAGNVLISNPTGTNNIAFSSGNVGIGLTNPTAKLELFGNYVNQKWGDGTRTGVIAINSDGADPQFRFEASNNHVFVTGSTERMRIAANGNVGIGTSSPSTLLHISKSGTSGGALLIQTLSANDAHLRLQDQSREFYIGTSGGNFYIYDNNAVLNRLVITSGGNILLGTITDNGERLFVSGSIRATGSITANSDVRLKKNLLKIENALEKVEQINGYTYEFKADDSKRHAGVIAQEIEGVLPEIVNKGADGLLGVEYGNISALLIEAIKEQQTQINELKALLNK